MIAHSWHLGPMARHTVWPRPTIRGLTSFQCSLGSHDSSSLRVFSGVCALGFLWFQVSAQPSRFEILCTCVSVRWEESVGGWLVVIRLCH